MSVITSSHKVIDAETVASTAEVNSESLFIGYAKKVSVSYQIASGTTKHVKVQIQQSMDDSSWTTPEGMEDLEEDLNDTDLHMRDVETIVGRYMRIVATGVLSNGANTVISAWITLREEA